MIVDLCFNGGRLYRISERPSSGVTEKGYSKGYAKMSPEDTAQFVRSTIAILGAPNLLPYTGFRKRNFVWIDGDVRAKLETEIHDDGRQGVGFDLLVFPKLGWGHETDDATGFSQAMTLINLKEWGEDHKPPILRPMPVGLFGLRLGMVPWQVREVFPETTISSSSTSDNREMYGGFGNEQSNLQVHFWNGTLYSFCYMRFDVSPEEGANFRAKLFADLGTPSYYFKPNNAGEGNDAIDWEDESRQLRIMLDLVDASKNPAAAKMQDKLPASEDKWRSSIVTCLWDKGVSEQEKFITNALTFDEVTTHSFF
jgi:hypothetical protein